MSRKLAALALVAVATLITACEPVVHYSDCADSQHAQAPLHRGEPGYSRGLDRDGNGVACE
jgi:hypothetical protein